ncbi:MAG TPA: GTP pyrophosphokinase [Eggerthellaceae bacterium]|nr:GTP pyrophosphokinase [Eggerthellaceae bacterium]
MLETECIYGANRSQMEQLQNELEESIADLRTRICAQTGLDPVEHCLTRIKSEESMREKCRRRGLPETPHSALVEIHDAIGFRVVCAFLNDVQLVRNHLAALDGFEVFEEKDYIRNAKPNGYRSFHMILRTADGRSPIGCDEGPDGGGDARGFFVEVQLRTISMDTWAALEHHLKYKKEAPANEGLIIAELKRCADELASTDLSMQALHDLIMEQR